MGVQAERAIETLHEMRAVIKRWPKDPNPEDVHQLRTTVRRLEALGDLLQLRSKSHESKIWKVAGALRKSAGKVRDLDVLTELARTHGGNRRSAPREELIERIQSMRREALEVLNRKIEKRRKLLTRALAKQRKRILKAVAVDDDKQASNCEEPLHDQAAKVIGAGRITQANAHDFRIQVRKLRDMLGFCDSANRKTLKRLAAVKDAIGVWHDWQELETLAESVLQSPRDERFLHQLRRTTQVKLRDALKSANRLQGLKERELANLPPRKN